MRKNQKILLPLIVCSCLINAPFVNHLSNDISNKYSNVSNSAIKGLEIKMIDLHAEFGDSTLITYNDKHILIDAGGDKNSGQYIYDAIKDIKTIDFMVFTHADSDHIYNFQTTTGVAKWFNNGGVVEHFIDFDTDLDIKKSLYTGLSDLSNLSKYRLQRDSLLNLKKIKNYHSAYECVKNENGAQESYKLGNNATFRILNNYFYDHNLVASDSANKNCLSVCCLLTVNSHNYLFTGDLEEFDSARKLHDGDDDYLSQDDSAKNYKRIYGETMLVALNYKYLRDGVDFFKAGHHGSYTSNSANLLDVIRPKFIGISCCFKERDSKKRIAMPGQIALNNMSKWTDYIYIQNRYKDDKEEEIIPYHGNIIFHANSNGENYECYTDLTNSTNNPNGVLTDVYLESRASTMHVYTLGEIEKNGSGLYFQYQKNPRMIKEDEELDTYLSYLKELYEQNYKYSNQSAKLTNATYIKLGHIDILINFGNDNLQTLEETYNNIKKVEYLCNDHVLDYLIVSYYDIACYSSLLGKKGLLNSKSIKKINNFYHFGYKNLKLNEGMVKDVSNILGSQMIKKSEIKTSDDLSGKIIPIIENENFSLQFNFLNLFNTQTNINSDANMSSVSRRNFTLQFFIEAKYRTETYRYANIGFMSDYKHLKTNIINNNSSKFTKTIDTFDLMSHGYMNDSSTFNYFESLYKSINVDDILFNGTYSFDDKSLNNIHPSDDECFANLRVLSTAYENLNGKTKNEIKGGNLITSLKFGTFGSNSKNNGQTKYSTAFRKQNYFYNSCDYFSNIVTSAIIKSDVGIITHKQG